MYVLYGLEPWIIFNLECFFFRKYFIIFDILKRIAAIEKKLLKFDLILLLVNIKIAVTLFFQKFFQ